MQCTITDLVSLPSKMLYTLILFKFHPEPPRRFPNFGKAYLSYCLFTSRFSTTLSTSYFHFFLLEVTAGFAELPITIFHLRITRKEFCTACLTHSLNRHKYLAYAT